MRYEIMLMPRAVHGMSRLRAHERAEVADAMEIHLQYQPEMVSKSRIKRLRGYGRPQYRLRVGEVRVFYDVVGSEVQVLGVVVKTHADEWLTMFGEPS
jgi:mRNA interferase RelE/StbE